MDTIKFNPEVARAALHEAGYPHVEVVPNPTSLTGFAFRWSKPTPPLIIVWRAWYLAGSRASCFNCFEYNSNRSWNEEPIVCDHEVVWT